MSDGTGEFLDAFDPDIPAQPAAKGQSFWRQQAEYLPAAGLFLTGLVLWELAVRVFEIQEILLPKPTSILSAFSEQFSTVVASGWATFREALGGFVAGGTLGVLMALLATRWEGLREGVLPFAIAANSAPIIALAPISNLWFGITDPVSKMVVVAIIVFFPVMINTVRGLTEVDASEIELLRSYAASPREVMLRVRVPHALPYLFNALKVGATLSVIAAIVAEYFGGPRNTLGVFITQNASLGKLPEAWAAVIIGSIIGISFYGAILLAERMLMPWHVSFRTTET
ncbi:MAG: ABC transporter permease [Acidimicrobiia bacterium]|nr:ABC transporter permease [Acidimicrobiia bacterium]